MAEIEENTKRQNVQMFKCSEGYFSTGGGARTLLYKG